MRAEGCPLVPSVISLSLSWHTSARWHDPAGCKAQPEGVHAGILVESESHSVRRGELLNKPPVGNATRAVTDISTCTTHPPILIIGFWQTAAVGVLGHISSNQMFTDDIVCGTL